MKDRFIQSQLTTINEKLEENTKMKSNIKLISDLMAIALITFTIGGAFSFPPFALASGICLGASIIAKKKYNQIYSDKIERLNKEKKHLETISNEVPTASTELNKKRMKKIKALRNAKKDAESSYETSKSINGLAHVIETTGVVLSFVNPWFSLIGFGGLVVNTINSKNMIKKNKEKETIENRINNIENDLQVIINEERDKQGQRIKTRKVMKPEKENKKTKTNTLNQQAVDKYVDNLANQNKDNKTNQKIKK